MGDVRVRVSRVGLSPHAAHGVREARGLLVVRQGLVALEPRVARVERALGVRAARRAAHEGAARDHLFGVGLHDVDVELLVPPLVPILPHVERELLGAPRPAQHLLVIRAVRHAGLRHVAVEALEVVGVEQRDGQRRDEPDGADLRKPAREALPAGAARQGRQGLAEARDALDVDVARVLGEAPRGARVERRGDDRREPLGHDRHGGEDPPVARRVRAAEAVQLGALQLRLPGVPKEELQRAYQRVDLCDQHGNAQLGHQDDEEVHADAKQSLQEPRVDQQLQRVEERGQNGPDRVDQKLRARRQDVVGHAQGQVERRRAEEHQVGHEAVEGPYQRTEVQRRRVQRLGQAPRRLRPEHDRVGLGFAVALLQPRLVGVEATAKAGRRRVVEVAKVPAKVEVADHALVRLLEEDLREHLEHEGHARRHRVEHEGVPKREEGAVAQLGDDVVQQRDQIPRRLQKSQQQRAIVECLFGVPVDPEQQAVQQEEEEEEASKGDEELQRGLEAHQEQLEDCQSRWQRERAVHRLVERKGGHAARARSRSANQLRLAHT